MSRVVVPLLGIPCAWCHRPAAWLIVSRSGREVGHVPGGAGDDLPVCPTEANPARAHRPGGGTDF